ncbi:FixH family protein [Mucilaginibacter defluvii]|uniref:Nitrogen fixation protein FixH n=1 Tax=Mucilaginibacter defluvii TaxID=1196019 RepID=A0ABP9FZI1_9SPHI
MEAIKNWNWGKWLVTGMVTFMLFIICMAVYMLMQPADDYDNSYYEKGLAYNSEYSQQKNVQQDNAQPVIKVAGNTLNIQFTGEANGKLTFLRPSGQRFDKAMDLATGTGGLFSVPLTDFKQGRWQLVINWQQGSSQYLYKQEITLP